MNIPGVTRVTPFDQLNLVLCKVTFDSKLTADVRATLTSTVDEFNKTIPRRNAPQPVFFLDFMPDGVTVSICQRNGRERPTRALFDQLVQDLGLSLPEQANAVTRVVEGTAPVSAPHQPKSQHGLFVKRHQGFGR